MFFYEILQIFSQDLIPFTEPEVKKPVKKEEKTKQTQKGGKSNNEGKTERHNSGSRFSIFLFGHK